jgi:hypothetical protein
MSDRIPQTRTVVIALCIAALLVMWQSIPALWGAAEVRQAALQARRTYLDANIRAYRVEFANSCFCFRKHLRVTVVDGHVVQVEHMRLGDWYDDFPDEVLLTTRTLPKEDRWLERYVLFPQVFRTIATDPDISGAQFDGPFGTPTTAWIDGDPMVTDDEFTFFWHDYEVLNR